MSDAGGFSKEVALKVMHYEGDAADDIARRLRDEARVLGLIQHRAVVGVNSLVPLKKGWGVVMEYIDGADLSRVLKSRSIPIAAAVQVVEEVAAALDAAYNTINHITNEPLRLIHRDIQAIQHSNHAKRRRKTARLWCGARGLPQQRGGRSYRLRDGFTAIHGSRAPRRNRKNTMVMSTHSGSFSPIY